MTKTSKDRPSKPPTTQTDINGGVNANTDGGSMDIGHDVVGRDKKIGTYIENLYAGNPASTEPPLPPVAAESPVTLPGDPTPLARASGSPFVVGRPLRANEPIFGRDDAFRFIADQLNHFSSVNIVGERRMGKSSLLNHLLGNQSKYLPAQDDQPSLVLAHVDLQRGVTNSSQFYGVALREVLAHLPPSHSAEANEFQTLRQRLTAHPECDYIEFDRTLKQLRDQRGVSVRPVLVIDEFEHLLDPTFKPGFPFPTFFDGLRALITAELLALIVASRKTLAEHFADHPESVTSTLPSYLTPFKLGGIDAASADALLLQPSDRTLTLAEVAEARRWAATHPCHLQCAGEAQYEAKRDGHSTEWAQTRFTELVAQSCMVRQMIKSPTEQPKRLLRVLHAIFIQAPMRIGRIAQKIGAKLDDVAAWFIGAAVIIILLLVLLGLANALDVVGLIKKALGLQP
jgi:hypothetical protein